MGLVEHARHRDHVGDGRAGLHAPGQAQGRVQICLGHRDFSGERRQVAQTLDLLGQRGGGGFRQLLLLQLLEIGAALAVLFALFAQFFLKHLEALVQEDPPLLALEAVVDALGYLVLERDELVLLDEGLEQKKQTGLGLVSFEQLLLAVGPDHQIRRHDVDHLLRIGHDLERRLGLLRKLRRLAHVAGRTPAPPNP